MNLFYLLMLLKLVKKKKKKKKNSARLARSDAAEAMGASAGRLSGRGYRRRYPGGMAVVEGARRATRGKRRRSIPRPGRPARRDRAAQPLGRGGG